MCRNEICRNYRCKDTKMFHKLNKHDKKKQQRNYTHKAVGSHEENINIKVSQMKTIYIFFKCSLLIARCSKINSCSAGAKSKY